LKNGGDDGLPFFESSNKQRDRTSTRKRQLMKGVPLFLLPYDRGTAAERSEQPMKCTNVNGHDYATRTHGDPTANAALNNIMRSSERPARPQRIRYTTDGRTQVIRYA